MNKLQEYIETHPENWRHWEAMNALQDEGLISDECITLADVADSDCEEAVAWLEANV
jgi:hypothetical protein